jgi:hypothetical protein
MMMQVFFKQPARYQNQSAITSDLVLNEASRNPPPDVDRRQLMRRIQRLGRKCYAGRAIGNPEGGCAWS